MEVITIQSEAFQKIILKLDDLQKAFEKSQSRGPLSEVWLTNEDVSKLLKVSKRLLQEYRNQGKISFSQIAGKIYYKASDIELYLNKHYVRAFKK